MTAADLGKQLVEHEGINDRDSRRQRRQKMEAVLEKERSFSKNILRGALIAWGITMLGPIGGFLMLLSPGNSGSVAVFALLAMLGGLAFWVALITTAAWLFRSRSTTMSAIELRLANLEELVEDSLRNDRS